jgi:hypothetical protein
MSFPTCSGNQTLSQKSLLAYLPSKIDSTTVIVASTGRTMSITDQLPATIKKNLQAGIWLPVELNSPRKLLLYNESNWVITSFDPSSRLVCLDLYNPTGIRHLTITIPIPNTKKF